MKQAYSVDYEDGERQINLRTDIEASLPCEEVKLRHGPFDGLTARVESGESRMIITQARLTTSQIPPPVIAYEYKRDPKAQFNCVGHKEIDPFEPDAISATPVDDSDFREGFFRGLHRASSLLLLESERHMGKKEWEAERVCSDMVRKLREVADAMGFHRQDLYSLYPGDEYQLKAKAAKK